MLEEAEVAPILIGLAVGFVVFWIDNKRRNGRNGR
jgi:hypothetical protein